MPLAVVTAAVILVGWFPVNAIWHQQSQLDSATAQITAIKNQQRALTLQATSIDSRAAATLLAREQYQLVRPGQSLIQVLPGNGSVSQSTGDPGLQPLVSPSSVSTLVAATPAKTSPHHSSANAFVSRLLRTLEFWR
ncbi:MAG TPA: septum formation initiator family protein [Acidimicrobiales bacterium]